MFECTGLLFDCKSLLNWMNLRYLEWILGFQERIELNSKVEKVTILEYDYF